MDVECPHCNGTIGPGPLDDHPPKPGDFLVCAVCHGLSRFTDRGVEKATDEDYKVAVDEGQLDLMLDMIQFSAETKREIYSEYKTKILKLTEGPRSPEALEKFIQWSLEFAELITELRIEIPPEDLPFHRALAGILDSMEAELAQEKDSRSPGNDAG